MCGKNIRLKSMFHLGEGELSDIPPPVSPGKNQARFMNCNSFIVLVEHVSNWSALIFCT